MNVAARAPLGDADTLNLISLCTGGGGLDLGVELALPGARPVCYVEREAFGCAHLVAAIEAGLMADAPLWSDARTFNGRPWRGAVDGVIGGIPCQPHSLAGKRGGADDERDLWSDARRIIVQSGAWFVLIENVPGMLTAKVGQVPGAERVWRDLQRLGFAVEIGLFSAAEVGASHGRERVFILGVAHTRLPEPSGRHGGAATGGRGSAARGTAEHQSAPRDRQLADADRQRSQGVGSDAGTVGRQDARRPAGLCDRADMVDAAGIGWGKGRPEPAIRRGRNAATGPERAMGDANMPFLSRQPSAGQHPLDEPDAGIGRADFGAFPPGPGDADRWAAVLAERPDRAPSVEPGVRGMADGLAGGVDVHGFARVERLAMLGNGVVPLQAGYAIRTLIARLAARNAPGADRLVRVMEAET